MAAGFTPDHHMEALEHNCLEATFACGCKEPARAHLACGFVNAGPTPYHQMGALEHSTWEPPLPETRELLQDPLQGGCGASGLWRVGPQAS